MSWGEPIWLYGLFLPALLLLATLLRGSSAVRSLGRPKAPRVSAGLSSVHPLSRPPRHRRRIALALGLALIICGLARPRWGTIERPVFNRSREVIIAMDLSKSMLAEDIRPSRLERAKLTVESLLDSLQGESVGLIVFAGTAFLQSPMSPDYQILRSFLKQLNPSFVPQGGTNYRRMIETALDSFKQSDSQADRFLIVISDGESQTDDWKAAAQELRDQNVRAICLGFGTTEGALIPDGSGGYHKDAQGAVVLTRLEPSTLRQLASLTRGVYREANTWIDLSALIEDTVKRGRTGLTGESRESQAVERYQYFVGAGLVLLLLSLCFEFPTLPQPRQLKLKGGAA